jgi:hopene-associated glycosyltransferase HpnB
MVARLIDQDLDLASLMVRLSTMSLAERAMVPAFVFFFRLLYPFRWVNDPGHAAAAAAGGYILMRRRMLARIGGLAAIRHALIDDCALAAAVKSHQGRIWLGLSRRTASLRVYAGLGGLWRMIARSAYSQLNRSPLLLAATVAAMAIGFLVPPAVVLTGGPAVLPAAVAWAAMAAAYVPMLRFYDLSAVWGPLLPLVVLVYMGATLDSARRHWLGRGGEWKGRVQASPQSGKE